MRVHVSYYDQTEITGSDLYFDTLHLSRELRPCASAYDLRPLQEHYVQPTLVERSARLLQYIYYITQ